MISQITEKIMPGIKEWQQRPLEAVYTHVVMDAIYCISRVLPANGLISEIMI